MKKYIVALVIVSITMSYGMNSIRYSLADILNLPDEKFENIRREERTENQDGISVSIESYYANVSAWLLSAHKRSYKNCVSFDGGMINMTTQRVFPLRQVVNLFDKLSMVHNAQNKNLDIRNNFDNPATTEKIKHSNIKVTPFKAGKTLQILKEQQKME